MASCVSFKIIIFLGILNFVFPVCYVAFRSLMKNETTNNKKYVPFQKEMVNSLVVAPIARRRE